MSRFAPIPPPGGSLFPSPAVPGPAGVEQAPPGAPPGGSRERAHGEALDPVAVGVEASAVRFDLPHPRPAAALCRVRALGRDMTTTMWRWSRRPPRGPWGGAVSLVGR